MPKYLLQVNYATEGVKGLLKEGGTKRRAVAEQAAKSMGGNLESYYFAFGDTDCYVICDFPDNASMASLALTISASGAVTVKTTVLMTCEELDAAAKKSPVYRAPGQ